MCSQSPGTCLHCYVTKPSSSYQKGLASQSLRLPTNGFSSHRHFFLIIFPGTGQKISFERKILHLLSIFFYVSPRLPRKKLAVKNDCGGVTTFRNLSCSLGMLGIVTPPHPSSGFQSPSVQTKQNVVILCCFQLSLRKTRTASYSSPSCLLAPKSAKTLSFLADSREDADLEPRVRELVTSITACSKPKPFCSTGNRPNREGSDPEIFTSASAGVNFRLLKVIPSLNLPTHIATRGVFPT
jgi:hypothetical protein